MTKPRLAYFGVVHFPAKGGVSRTTEYLISQLKDEFDITIYCIPHPDATEHIRGVRTVQIPSPGIGKGGVFIHFVLCMLHIWFFGKYDLLHVRKIDAAVFIPFLRWKVKKILATSHESPYLRDKWGRIAKSYFRFGEKVFIRSKAKLTVISKTLSEYYYQRYGRAVQFVPNGVDAVRDFSSSKASEIIKQFNIKPPFIAFAGRRIMSTKGLHTFLRAAKITEERRPILLAGESGHSQKYMDQIRELSSGLSVINIGYIRDKVTLMDILRKAELFVFPSETEGMSIMLLEVASLGIPIIASDIPENTSVFTEQEITFFENKNAADLALKLSNFSMSKEEYLNKAKRAKQRVESEYSGHVMFEHYRKFYWELVNS